MLLINKTLLGMSKGIRLWIVLITLLKLAVLAGTASFAQAISGYLGSVTDPQLSVEGLPQAILTALLSAAVVLVGEVLLGEAEFLCTARARIMLRKRLLSKVLLLDVGNIDKIGMSSTVTSVSDGVESMQIYYSRYLPGLLYCLVAPIYMFFRLREASMPVAIFLLVVSILLLPANNFFRSVVTNLRDKYWGSFRSLTGYFLESLQSLTTLKLFNRDAQRSDNIREKAQDFNLRIMDVMKVNFRAFLFSDGVIYLSVFIGVAIMAYGLIEGSVTLSAALMVLMLGYSFFASIRQLMGASHSALAGVAAAQNVSDLLDIDTSRPVKPYKKDEKGYDGIRIRDVRFSYAQRSAALEHLSIDIKKGTTVALAGVSGSGKSTITGLLMRFYDPSEGVIEIEGVDYACIPPDELRKQIAMVPQQVTVFSGTIEDNLRLASPNAAQEELWEVLRLVRLADWVRAQPMGLQTDVGDAGAKLSGGQRQKIGIARVLLCDAPYIILDEATSSVDVDSEREIWACIRELKNTRTLIIISHRLSAIRDADTIFVLSKGEVIQKGNHAQLMQDAGLYRDLVLEQDILESYGEKRAQKERSAI